MIRIQSQLTNDSDRDILSLATELMTNLNLPYIFSEIIDKGSDRDPFRHCKSPTTALQYNAIVRFNSSKEISLPKAFFIFPAKVLCNGAVQLVLGFCRVTRPSLGQRLVFPGSSVATALRAYLISGQ